MFGSIHSMTPLETRKRLLVAESDLLRVQLSEDGERLKSAWDRSAVRARFWGGLVASLAVLMTGLSALRQNTSGDASKHASWGGRFLQGASLISTLWLSWKRARGGSS